MKPFLLIAGDNFYPCSGTGDWIGTFETREEIEKTITKVSPYHNCYNFQRGDRRFDWYEIVDLRNWINDNEQTN